MATQTRGEIIAEKRKALAFWENQYLDEGRKPDQARRMALASVGREFNIPNEQALIGDFIGNAYQAFLKEGKDPAKAEQLARLQWRAELADASPEDLASLDDLATYGIGQC